MGVFKGQLHSSVFKGHHSHPTRHQDEVVSLTDNLPLCRFNNGHYIQLTQISRPKDEDPKEGEASKGCGRPVLSLLESCSSSRFSEAANWRAPLVQATPSLLFEQTSHKWSWVPADPPSECRWQQFQ